MGTGMGVNGLRSHAHGLPNLENLPWNMQLNMPGESVLARDLRFGHEWLPREMWSPTRVASRGKACQASKQIGCALFAAA